MKKTILFNVGEQVTRIAILESGELVELSIEENANKNAVGNVYKGVIEEVVPGLQAVFVNIGMGRNAFLHFNDINLDSFVAEALKERQAVRRRTRSRPREGPAPDQGYYIRVEDCLRRGREILVQMTKEPIGTKGARVSANLAIPGRYMVLLPGAEENSGGVSKKIEDVAERKRLKRFLSEIDAPGCSFIIRTAAVGKKMEDLENDSDALLDLWDEIQERYKTAKKGECVHAEESGIHRFARDFVPEDVEQIIVDSDSARGQLVDALGDFLPQLVDKVRLHTGPEGIFEKFGVEKSIDQALSRSVPMKSGGHVVFDETEALTAIDINSGKYMGAKDQEKTILRTNLEAAEVVARQLRVRDIGGLIVIDFIDMATRDAQRKVLETFRKELNKDRTKVSLASGFSDFGCLEMTRKRVRNSLRRTLTRECTYCAGTGRIAIASQVWNRVRDQLNRQMARRRGGNYEIVVHPHMYDHLTEKLGHVLSDWERSFQARIDVRAQKTFHFETFSLLRNGKVFAESAMEKVDSFHDVDYIAPARGAAPPEPRRAASSSPAPAAAYQDGYDDEDEEDDDAPARPAAAANGAEPAGDDAREGGRRRRRRRGRGGRGDAPRAAEGQASEAQPPAPSRYLDEVADDEAPRAAAPAEREERAGDDAREGGRRRRRRRGARDRVLDRQRDRVEEDDRAASSKAAEEDSDADFAAEDDEFEGAVIAVGPGGAKIVSAASIDEDDEEEFDEDLSAEDEEFEEEDEDEEELEDEAEPVAASSDAEPRDDRRGGRDRDRGDRGDRGRGRGRDRDRGGRGGRGDRGAPRAASSAPAKPKEPAPVYDPGLYSDIASVVKQRRKLKRARFDWGQKPESHYGWTAMGPQPGSGKPAKVARKANSVVALDDEHNVEPSLMARDYVAAKEASSGGAKAAASSSRGAAELADKKGYRLRRRGGSSDAAASQPQADSGASSAEEKPAAGQRRRRGGSAAKAEAKPAGETKVEAKPAAKAEAAAEAPVRGTRRKVGAAKAAPAAKQAESKPAAAKAASTTSRRSASAKDASEKKAAAKATTTKAAAKAAPAKSTAKAKGASKASAEKKPAADAKKKAATARSSRAKKA